MEIPNKQYVIIFFATATFDSLCDSCITQIQK